MTRVVLSIGSNLGDRLARLQSVADGLGGAVRAVSPVYETKAWGGVEQGPFLNAVLIAQAPLDCHGWLHRAHELEAAAGRVRASRWGPRTLDADVLWIDGVTIEDPDLTVPHPRWRERRFVLAPLAELAPDLVAEGDLAASGGRVAVVGTL